MQLFLMRELKSGFMPVMTKPAVYEGVFLYSRGLISHPEHQQVSL